ncbi:MAG: hypothetical protein LBG20_00040 [Holosporaceae bacterium]|jgi:hypothetical protein|nr:hypothetical protein [Holosporaceae bacterium]
MIPWDLGLIRAMGKELAFAIFPSHPPEEMRKTPYLIFELKNVLQGKNLISRVEFSITVMDGKEVTSASYNVLKAINKIISKELILAQDDAEIGRAKIKIDSVESKKNNLMVHLVAILKMKAIYEDEDE